MLRRFDFILAGAILLLSILGLVVLHAISFRDTALAADFNTNMQILAFAIGLIMFFMFARTDYRLWFRFSYVCYGLGLGLLLLVLAIGTTTANAKLAIDLGFIQFQPAEVIKIPVIIMLAYVLSKYADRLTRWHWFMASLIYILVPLGLVAAQPDLGSGMVLGFIWLMMVLLSKIRKGHLLLLITLGGLCLPLAISQLEPYQQDRLQTFLNPAADPQGAGYNVVQSTIAVGSGQLLGKGLGAGSQGQLNFLPSQHTDFIFAILAEKLGFLGAMVTLLLFGVVLLRGILIAAQAEDQFGMSLAVGVVAMFFFHIVINIGMNLGIMPVTGIPLPFLSYGGTNLIISLMAAGLLESVAIHSHKLEFSG